MQRIGVVGAGTMGHGIAQVCAAAGMEVWLADQKAEFVAHGLQKIEENLNKGVARGKIEPDTVAPTLARLHGTTNLEELGDGANWIVEAIPEKLALKQQLFQQLQQIMN